MAYLRYSKDCDWYVFAQHSPEASEEMLAIWHVEHRSEGPVFPLSLVRTMLTTSDYSPIPGYTPEAKSLLQIALSEFVRDFESES